MEICFTYDGKPHSMLIPAIQLPVQWRRPGTGGPINYPTIMQDAIIIASMKDLIQHVSDETVRAALNEGISAGVKVMQTHAGEDVKIT